MIKTRIYSNYLLYRPTLQADARKTIAETAPISSGKSFAPFGEPLFINTSFSSCPSRPLIIFPSIKWLGLHRTAASVNCWVNLMCADSFARRDSVVSVARVICPIYIGILGFNEISNLYKFNTYHVFPWPPGALFYSMNSHPRRESSRHP